MKFNSSNFQAWKSFVKVMEFYFTNICIIELYLFRCVYRIVLLIPAGFEFIMREISANSY